MIKRWMHRRERYFAMRDNDRVVHPFGWGMEFVGGDANGRDPREFFREYSRRKVETSDEFFFSPEISGSEYRLEPAEGQLELQLKTLTWPSGVTTPDVANNTAYATYFPNDKSNKTAVLIL